MLLYNHSKLRISACNASASDSLVVSTDAEEDAESAQIFEVFFFFFFFLIYFLGLLSNGKIDLTKVIRIRTG